MNETEKTVGDDGNPYLAIGSSVGTAPWTIHYEDGEQAWAVELGGIRRALIPYGGVHDYRSRTSRLLHVQCTQEGAWLVAEGQVRLEDGEETTIFVRDVVRLDHEQLELHRSWWHTAPCTISGVELAIEVLPVGTMEEHLVPGCLYDGNRQASPDRLVPRLNGTSLFEEHKCPTPLVYARCRERDGRRFGIGLLPEPCPVVDGNVPDQWWSLGLKVNGSAVTLISVSGRLAVNGEDERIYDGQNRIAPYPDAWVNARPRHVYEKRIRLALQAHPAQIWSWRETLHTVIAAQLTPPETEEALISPPALEEAIRLKTGYALRRWYDDGACAGMLWYPNRTEYEQARQSVEYGWVGQNMRLGTCLWRWGRRIGDAELCRRGERCAEVWVRAAEAALAADLVVPTHYIIGTGWRDTNGAEDGYARPTTETLFELADFCQRERAVGTPHFDWERVLFAALEFYSKPERFDHDGLFPLRWNPRGLPQPGPTVTAGALMVAALSKAALLPGGTHWLERAWEIWQRYAAVFLNDAPRHPCGSALDSCCEDMESGMFLLISGLRLSETMRTLARPADSRLTQQTARAADWVLSWTYTWNVPLLPGSILDSAGSGTKGWSDVLAQNHSRRPFTPAAALPPWAAELGRFSTVGLSDVSVQNRHLHVFSATAEFLHLSNVTSGELAEHYRRQARRMLIPIVRTIARPQCHWGMDEEGEQTEQYNQTNYVQHPHDPVCRPRGGIARWFVPWITVWVLSVCLDFLENDGTRPVE